MKTVTLYQSNHRQPQACRTAAHYRYLRQSIRRLKSHSPTHYAVLWYADSLGMDAYSVAVTTRSEHFGRVWASGVTGPVGKLP